uniref:C2H2-type domain-containing protein n=1 Tax=Oryza brachyantha TaxID=4533 RepID=J3MXJ8_ORYBR
SSGVKRQLTAGTSPAKKPRSQEMINCSLCNVSVTSPQELVKHRASLLHRSNLAPLQSGNKATAATAMAMNTEAAQHAEKKAAEKSELSEWSGGSAYHQQHLYFCDICSVRCSSVKMMESHLAGRRHRERQNSMFM